MMYMLQGLLAFLAGFTPSRFATIPIHESNTRLAIHDAPN